MVCDRTRFSNAIPGDEDIFGTCSGEVDDQDIKRLVNRVGKWGRFMLREALGRDQFGNDYIVFRAILLDGGEYDVGDRILPSIILEHKGITDDLWAKYRLKALRAFADQSRIVGLKMAGFLPNDADEEQEQEATA